jgi:hypothetical protein
MGRAVAEVDVQALVAMVVLPFVGMAVAVDRAVVVDMEMLVGMVMLPLMGVGVFVGLALDPGFALAAAAYCAHGILLAI